MRWPPLRAALLPLLVVVMAMVGTRPWSAEGAAQAQWYQAMEINFESDSFWYTSDLWDTADEPWEEWDGSGNVNRLLAPYFDIYVEKVMVQMNGKSVKFELFDNDKGRYTLRQLVVAEGGLEMVADGFEVIDLRGTASNLFEFTTAQVDMSSNIYCHGWGIHYGTYTRVRHWDLDHPRVRLGGVMTSAGSYPCTTNNPAAEGIGLDVDYNEDVNAPGLAAGRLSGNPADFFFAAANVSVYGFATNRTDERPFEAVKSDGYNTYKLENFNYGEVESASHRRTYVFMIKFIRTTLTADKDIFTHGDSTVDSALWVRTYDFRIGGSTNYENGASLYVYTDTEVRDNDHALAYHTMAIGRWYQVAFVIEAGMISIVVDGTAVTSEYQGKILTFDDANRTLSLGDFNGGFPAPAELSDFRYYSDQTLSGQELEELRQSWLEVHSACGDGFRAMNEACDDGNVLDGDGCSATCDVESGYVCLGGNTTAAREDACSPGETIMLIDFETNTTGLPAYSEWSDHSNGSFGGFARWDYTRMSAGASCVSTQDPNCYTTCGEHEIFGGYNLFGRCSSTNLCDSLNRTFENLPPHDFIQIDLGVLFGDTWDGDYFIVTVDDDRIMEYRLRYDRVSAATETGYYNLSNICGATSTWLDDHIDFNLRFYHNSSSLRIKINSTLNSNPNNEWIGLTYLDVRPGFSAGFVPYQGGVTTLAYELDASRKSDIGLKRLNGSSYDSTLGLRATYEPGQVWYRQNNYDRSRLAWVIPHTLTKDHFLEFFFNIKIDAITWTGFVVDIIRMENPARDLSTIHPGRCEYPDVDCPEFQMVRICYRVISYPWISSACDASNFPPTDLWNHETIEIYDKFAFKYGYPVADVDSKYVVLFSMETNTAGYLRNYEVSFDDLRVVYREPTDTSSCPSLHVSASASEAIIEVNGTEYRYNGTEDRFYVAVVDPATHLLDGGVLPQTMNESEFSKFVTANTIANFSKLVLVATKGVAQCYSDACSNALVDLGGSHFPWAPGVQASLSMIGSFGALLRSMSARTLEHVDGAAFLTSDIACHLVTDLAAPSRRVWSTIAKPTGYKSGRSFELIPNSMGYLGCYRWGSLIDRSGVCPAGHGTYHYFNTPQMCATCCATLGYNIGQMYQWHACYCANEYGTEVCTTTGDCGGPRVPDASCWQTCGGDPAQTCGTVSGSQRFYRAFAALPATYIDPSEISHVCREPGTAVQCQALYDNNDGSGVNRYYSRQHHLMTIPENEVVTFNLSRPRVIHKIRIQWNSIDLYHAQHWNWQYRKNQTAPWVVFFNTTDGHNSFLTTVDGINGLYDAIDGPDVGTISDLRFEMTKRGSEGATSRYYIRDIAFYEYDPYLAKHIETPLQNTLSVATDGEELFKLYDQTIKAYAGAVDPTDFFGMRQGDGQLYMTHALLNRQYQPNYVLRVATLDDIFDSGPFNMTVGDRNYIELQHGLGTLPLFVKIGVTVTQGKNQGSEFTGIGAAALDGEEVGEPYGGIIYAYNNETIRLWAPSNTSLGYIIHVWDGYAQTNQQRAQNATVRVYASGGTPPDYDSGWFDMASQTDNGSFALFQHKLGTLDMSIVRVVARAKNGPNAGFIFPATGAAQNDNDGGRYGGVVYAYNNESVAVWLPNNHTNDACTAGNESILQDSGFYVCRVCEGYPCTGNDGYAIFVPPGYGGGQYSQASHEIEVRVLIWDADDTYFASFTTDWGDMSAYGSAYFSGTHSLSSLGDWKISIVQDENDGRGWRFDAASASQGIDRRPHNRGGVIGALSATGFQAWAIVKSGPEIKQATGSLGFAGDGWGNGTLSVSYTIGKVRAVLWPYFVLANRDTREVRMEISAALSNQAPRIQTPNLVIDENFDASQPLITFSVDNEVGEPLTFSIVNSEDSFAFMIDTNGSLFVTDTSYVNFENKATYTLRIQVSDGLLTDESSFTLTLFDTNDAPELLRPYVYSVLEDSPKNTEVGTPLNGTDDDPFDTVLYYIVDGNLDSAFLVNSCGGQMRVLTSTALDYEEEVGHRQFNLTIMVQDDASPPANNTRNITINVRNKNDPPYWDLTALELFVPENSGVGFPVGTVRNKCYDVDEFDNLTYSTLVVVAVGADANDTGGGTASLDFFSIQNTSGIVEVGTAELNFEGPVQEYTITLRCTDYIAAHTGKVQEGTPNLYSDNDITVYVTDANDRPVFTKPVYDFFETENAAAGEVVGAIVATDEDVLDLVRYSLISDPSGYFEVVNTTGQVVVATGANLDFESVQNYTIVVGCEDYWTTLNKTDARLNNSAVVRITILDENEAPTITVPQNISIDENAPLNVFLGIVNATDPEMNTGAENVDFSIPLAVPAVAAAWLDIENFASQFYGRIVTDATVDYEAVLNNTAQITVRGSDSGGLFHDAILTLIVRDRNDPPVLRDLGGADCDELSLCDTFPVNEDLVAGSFMAQIPHFDPDNNALNFSLDATYIFTVNETGALRLRPSETLDFESLQSYTFQVTVEDKNTTGPKSFSATTTYRFLVQDVNEPPEPTAALASYAVREDATNGDFFGASCESLFVDPEGDFLQFNVSLTADYSERAVPHDNPFRVVPNAGLRRFSVHNNSQLHPPAAKYTFELNATDIGGLVGSMNITVVVASANTAPIFDQPSPFNCTVEENVAPGTKVCQLIVSDAQSDGTTIEMDTTSAFFELFFNPAFNDSVARVLTNNLGVGIPNFESQNSFSLVMRVFDDNTGGKFSLSTTEILTVGILDVNDAPVALLGAGATLDLEVNETAAVGTLLSNVSFFDEDGDPLLFETVAVGGGSGGTANSHQLFTCVNTSDVSCDVQVATPLDYETQTRHVFRVQALDPQGLGANVTMNVTVLPVNEPPSMTSRTLYISEGAVPGNATWWVGGASTFTLLNASDPESDNLAISVVGGSGSAYFEVQQQSPGAALYRIVVSSGAPVLDYESDTSFEVAVRVSDGQFSVQRNMTVNILNVPDVTVTNVVGGGFGPLTPSTLDPLVPGDVTVHGTNFDISDGGQTDFLVTYGPSGTEYTATNCSTPVSDNTRLDCLSAPGVGSFHTWRVAVRPSTWNHTAWSPDSIVTHYIRPVVTGTNYSRPLQTVGGAALTITGHAFGVPGVSQYEFGGEGRLSFSANTRTATKPFVLMYEVEEDFADEETTQLPHECRAANAMHGLEVGDTVRLTCASCSDAVLATMEYPYITATVQNKYATDGGDPTVANYAANPCILDPPSILDWLDLTDGEGDVLNLEYVWGMSALPGAMTKLLIVDPIPADSFKPADFVENNILEDWAVYVPAKPRVVMVDNADTPISGDPPTTGNPLSLTACSISVSNTEITCQVPAGVGHSFRLYVTVGGLVSDVSPASVAEVSYEVPIITQIHPLAPGVSTTLGNLSTLGGESLLVDGAFFGSSTAYAGYGAGTTKFGVLPFLFSTCAVSDVYASTHNVSVSVPGVSGGPFTVAASRLVCTTPAGVGINQSWIVTVGDQISARSTDTTSYVPPRIGSMQDDWPWSSTAGGDEVTIIGENFGPRTLDSRMRPMVAHFGRSDQFAMGTTFSTVPSECDVVLDDTQIVCIVGEGTGDNHSWELTLANQTSNRFYANSRFSRPLLQFFFVNASDVNNFPELTTEYITQGGQLVIVAGAHFGPAVHASGYETSRSAVATFEDEDGKRYPWRYENCSVTEDHFEMLCTTSEGAGSALAWELEVDGLTNTFATTSYGPPKVHQINATFNLSEGLDTAGGEQITLIGENFGPNESFIDRISYGPTGFEIPLLAPEQFADNCDLTIPHNEIVCTTVAGVGKGHRFLLKVGGQKTPSSFSGPTLSYKAPVLAAMNPTVGVTKGGYDVEVTGQYFGDDEDFKVLFQSAEMSYRFNFDGSVVIEMPEGQGLNRSFQIVQENSYCVDASCIQSSNTIDFAYRDPIIGKMTVTDVENQTELVQLSIEGLDDTLPYLDGGSYSSTQLWTTPDSIQYNNSVIVYNYDPNATTIAELTNPRLCDVLDDVADWTHDHIVCRVAKKNGSVVIRVGDQFSQIWTFAQLSPVLQNVHITPTASGDLPTSGGFNISILGQYFGKSASDVLVLLYHSTWLPETPCTGLELFDLGQDCGEECGRLNCTIPEGQAAYVNIIVRRPSAGGENFFLQGAPCQTQNPPSCFSYDPPDVVNMVGSRRRLRRLSGQSELPASASGATDATAATNKENEELARRLNKELTITDRVSGRRLALLPCGGLQVCLDTPTSGYNLVTITGNNFGFTSGLTLTVNGEVVLPVSSSDHTSIDTSVMEGVATSTFGASYPLTVQVANQVDGFASDILVRYDIPSVTDVRTFGSPVASVLMPTRGGTRITITGTDFGKAETVPVPTSLNTTSVGLVEAVPSDDGVVGELFVDLPSIGERPCTLVSWNHTEVVFEAPAGQGLNNEIRQRIDGSVEPLGGNPIGFLNYLPPVLNASISPPSGPTTGGIMLTLTGTNLGSSDADSREIVFGTLKTYSLTSGDTDSGAVPTWTHDQIVFELPEGQGKDVEVTVAIEGQTSNSVFFTYDPPRVDAFDCGSGNCILQSGPTDACDDYESLASWRQRLRNDPDAEYACEEGFYITIVGDNFGTQDVEVRVDETEQVCFTDPSASNPSSIPEWDCLDCPDNLGCGQTHNQLVLRAPQSFGTNKTIRAYLYDERDVASSTEIYYSYDAPQVDSTRPSPINALGGNVTISGSNFGGVASDSWVQIGKIVGNGTELYRVNCSTSSWNEGNPFYSDNGLPYVTCNMPRIAVGPQDVWLHVAEQTTFERGISEFSPFYARCRSETDSAGVVTLYYGIEIFTEYCLPCPDEANCVDGDAVPYTEPTAKEEFFRLYYDVDSARAKDRCNVERRTAPSQRTECPDFVGCIPADACLGNNECDKGYEYLVYECEDELSKYDSSELTCRDHTDCQDLLGANCDHRNPEACTRCEKDRIDDVTGKCTCMPSDRCTFCTVYEYYKINGECEPCPANVWVIIVLFITALIMFAVVGYILNKKKFNLAFISIGFDYFQVLAVFSSSKVPWPNIMVQFFLFIQFFSFDIDITAPECVMPDFTYETKWVLTMSFPLIAAGMFLILHIIFAIQKIAQGTAGWKKINAHHTTLVAMFVVMLYYLYLPLTRKILEIVNCNPAVPNDGYVYTEWTSLNCDGGLCRCWVPGEPQMQLFPWAIVCFCFYSVGYALFAAYIILMYNSKLKEDQLLRAMDLGDSRATNPDAFDLRQKYHKLYYHFKPGKVYWILVILGRKFWIALAALMFRDNPSFQLSFILLVLFIGFVLQVKHRPFMSSVEREEELLKHQIKVEEEQKKIAEAQEAGTQYMPSKVHMLIEQHLSVIQRQREVEDKRKKAEDLDNVEKRFADVRTYFWDYNTVELTLLASAIVVCTSGIMFQSGSQDSRTDLDAYLQGLAVVVMTVIITSLVYYFVVFASEVFVTFGMQNWKCIRYFMKQDDRFDVDAAEDDADFEMAAVIVNLDQAGDKKVEFEKREQDLEELREEHKRLQEQVSELKTKTKALEMQGDVGAVGGAGARRGSAVARTRKKKTLG